jgi:hypothetical protein
MTLEHLPDREMAASVASDTTITNLGGAIDRRVKETQQHEYWRTSTNLKAYAWISEGIERL